MDKIQARNMLETVVKHFSSNPKELRCLSATGSCSYAYQKNVPKSSGCAIGMFLPNELCIEMDNSANTSIDDIFDNPTLYKKLPKWMRDMDVNFLQSLQILHDQNKNWDLESNTISIIGKEKVNEIIKDYKLGKPMFKL